MTELTDKSCEPCRQGADPLTEEQIANLLPQVPDWQVEAIDGGARLSRSFRFKDFAQAMAFTNKVAEIAEKERHHPVIVTGWGLVTVSWWTHKINGLHRNDFIMAAKTDQLDSVAR